MISFNQTYDESRAIRVLVVPIGDNSLYSKHFEIVSRTRSLPVFDLNRPSGKAQSTLLKNFNWNSPSANIQFEYLRYDRAASGPVDMDNFQCSRRILVVIGVINYPELDATSSSRLEQDMDYYSRRHPHVVLRRYFVFNYFTAVAQLPPGSNPPLPQLPQYDSATKDPYAMVIFPPDGECEGGSMIDVHTKEIMGNVAVRIIQAIEDWLVGCEEIRLKLAASSAYTSTPVSLPVWLPLKLNSDDLEESIGASSSEINRRMRRRAPGRVQKWMGDLCMQVCSPLDAWDHYNLAISECRNQGDTVWLASSLEGSVSAMLAMYRLGGLIAEELSVLVKDVKSLLANVSTMTLLNALIRVCDERCVEAMNLYTKNLVYCGLEVECALRLAKMHEHLTPSPEKQQKVMDFVLRAAAVPGLSVAQQIECTLEGALSCLRVGLHRKYAFLLYIAALLSADSENSYVPHSLVQAASRQYGINFNDEGFVVERPDSSWAGMRRMLLAHGAHFAKEYKDTVSIARYMVTLLRLMGEMEANRNKNKKYWIGDTFSDENVPKDDQDLATASLAYQSNYAPWDSDTSRAVKFIETLNGIVLLPQKLLGSEKFDDSNHSTSGDLTQISRNLSSTTVSQFVESATGGISAAVRAVGGNRSMSTHSAPSFNLGMMRGTLTSSAGDLATLEDRDDIASEASEHRTTSELLTNSRGNIAVPKISPFVQNLVLKKKKHLKPVATPGVSTPPAAGDIPPLMRTNTTFELPINSVPPPSPDVSIKQIPQLPPAATSLQPSLTRSSIAPLTAPFPLFSDPSLRLGVPVDSQTQSLQTLMTVCAELPTATSLLLDGLPYVISLTPLSPPEEEAPLPMKASLGAKRNIPLSVPGAAKALFYDPFEAKRAKSRVKSSVMYWSNEKIAQIEAIFCNPLAIPLTLHDVHVLVEGVHHSCFYAKTIVIPPDAKEFKTTFLVCPRESGNIKIVGVRFSIYNAIYSCMIDQQTGKGQPALPRELSLPKKYPRTVSSEPSKIPSPYSFGNEIELENPSDVAAVPKEKEDKEKSPISEILVVPESATLSLHTSWGPDLGQTRLRNVNLCSHEETKSESLVDSHVPPYLSSRSGGNDPLTTSNSLTLTLYQREHRKEKIRLENLSPFLTIEDFQITVHCVLTSPDSSKEKKVSYALLPFSKLRFASTVFVPPVLSQSYFLMDVAKQAAADPPLPFLIRLSFPDDVNDQRILPLQYCLFELEFVNFSGSLLSSVTYDMRIEIDYISTFDGMEKFFRVPDNLNESSGEVEEAETVYIRKSLISTTVTLSPDIGISSCISLNNSHLPIIDSNFLSVCREESPSWIQSPHDASIIQATLSHFNRSYQEFKASTPGESIHNSQSDLFSYSSRRQFSLQVDNTSPFGVALSHNPFQSYYDSSLSSSLWDYFYPHETIHHKQQPLQSSDEPCPDSLIIKHLHPHSSANIIISIVEEKLWKWFHQYCIQEQKSLQDSIELLLQTIKMYWFIQTVSHTHSSESFGDQGSNSTVLPRTGMISFQNMNSQSLYKDLLLPMISSHFNGLPVPPSPDSSFIFPKMSVAVRKFHQMCVTIQYSIPLLLSYFQQLTIEQILKIEIESILLILPNDAIAPSLINKENSLNGNAMNLPLAIPHPLHTKNCILTGNPHKLIPIGMNLSQPFSEERDSVLHELSCCFTRCGGYKMYTIARFLIEYLPISATTRGAQELSSTTVSSSWWIPQQPVVIIAT